MISSVKVPTGLIVRSSSVSFTSFGGVLCASFTLRVLYLAQVVVIVLFTVVSTIYWLYS